MSKTDLWSHKGPHRFKKKVSRAERRKEARRDRENELSEPEYAQATATHTYGGRPRYRPVHVINLDTPGWTTRSGTPNSVRVVRSGHTRERGEKPYYRTSGFKKKLAYGILTAGAIAGTAIASRKLTKPGGLLGPKRPKVTVVPDVPKAPPVAAAAPRPTPAAAKPDTTATKAKAVGGKPKKAAKKGVTVDTGRPGTGKLGGAPRRPGVESPPEPMRIRKKSGVRKHRGTVNNAAFHVGLIEFARKGGEAEDRGQFAEDNSNLLAQAKRAGRQAGYIRKEVRTGANLAGDLHDVATGKKRDRRKKYEWEKVRFQDRVIKGAIGAAILGGTAYAARYRGK